MSDVIIKRLKKYSYYIRTVIFDSDMGLANHMMVAKALNADTFFTRQNTSQDKGTEENRKGHIRRLIFKNNDITSVTDEIMNRIEKS